MARFYLVLFTIAILTQISFCDKKKHKNKYSAEANMPAKTTEPTGMDFRNLERPFRMAKLNLIWSKAQHRLTEPKLLSLYTELKIHDKEELAWKQLNSQHKDKDGLKEAELRNKLIGIMSNYDLLEHFEDTQKPEEYKKFKKNTQKDSDAYLNKILFKDKKLNQLWQKAEVAGFSPDELRALKQEFQHHQDKLDMYYTLMDNLNDKPEDADAINTEELDRYNEITVLEEANEVNPNKKNEHMNAVNQIRDHHRKIRDGYDHLERKTSSGPQSKDFIEPKVQGLWRIALASNFTNDELDSLRHELKHYEARLLKLRNLNVEHAIQMSKLKKANHNDKHDHLSEMENVIKKQERKIEKIQEVIEDKIFRHPEL